MKTKLSVLFVWIFGGIAVNASAASNKNPILPADAPIIKSAEDQKRSEVILAEISGEAQPQQQCVRVSHKDPRYFELSDGRTFIPIGINMIAPDRGRDAETGLARMDEWMGRLALNGGNYLRVWLSSPFWDVEHERSGLYDTNKLSRTIALLNLARKHDIRVKLTLEHFRSIEGTARQGWAHKPIHHVSQGGPAKTMEDFFAGQSSRVQFQRKLDWFSKQIGDDPIIFGWELWNEINAVSGKGDYMAWTDIMLKELHRLFPRNMAMQSLGSFDTDRVRDTYRRLSVMQGNDVAQVHRYLDLGASLTVCHGSVDVLAADAVKELQAFSPNKPIILAESGAVEPRHTGPFKLYAKDKSGIILHDILFAPFFSGAAGPGQCWHWDSYVDKNNLWHQFGRFSEVVKNFDPVAEEVVVKQLEHPRLRIYILQGKKTVLMWCRDKQNDWKTELEQNQAPESLKHEILSLKGLLSSPGSAAKVFNPWIPEWHDLGVVQGSIQLPEFSRSVIVRLRMHGQ